MGYKRLPDFTNKDLEFIEKLSGYGLNQEKMADCFKMSRRSFQNRIEKDPRVKEAVHRGYAKAEARVAQVAFDQAVSGHNTTMTIFWLKTRAGWKETQVHELSKTTIEDIVNGASEKAIEDSGPRMKLVGDSKK